MSEGKLAPESVTALRQLARAGKLRYADAARHFGVCPRTVRDAVRGVSYRWVNGIEAAVRTPPRVATIACPRCDAPAERAWVFCADCGAQYVVYGGTSDARA